MMHQPSYNKQIGLHKPTPTHTHTGERKLYDIKY
jgi:hypothetical protein